MTQDGFNEHHSDHRIEFALTQARKINEKFSFLKEENKYIILSKDI